MAGLAQWLFDESFGIQIWEDPQRPGRKSGGVLR